MASEIFTYFGSIPAQVISEKMQELAEKVNYHYNNLEWLKSAFYTEIKYSTNKEKYANSPLGTLGDRVLSLIIAEILFDKGHSSESITVIKSFTESNDQWFQINNDYGLFHYAYNDTCFYDEARASQGRAYSFEQLPNAKHNRYFEALIGAIYKDLGFDATKEYVKEFLGQWRAKQ